MSEDGGKTLRNGSEDQEVHGDFHAMWLDPTHPDRYYELVQKVAKKRKEREIIESFELFI